MPALRAVMLPLLKTMFFSKPRGTVLGYSTSVSRAATQSRGSRFLCVRQRTNEVRARRRPLRVEDGRLEGVARRGRRACSCAVMSTQRPMSPCRCRTPERMSSALLLKSLSRASRASVRRAQRRAAAQWGVMNGQRSAEREPMLFKLFKQSSRRGSQFVRGERKLASADY